MDILNARNARPPKYDKDTHVNLDMQMWITHNQTKVAYPTPATYATKPPTTYPPKTYPSTTYKPYKPYRTTTQKRDVPA